MKRYITKNVLKDLGKKIILISGPRQVGKTTLSQSLCSEYEYLNYDSIEDQLILREKSWRREVALLILDEIHKMPNWKRWLKGIYDREGNEPNIIVTGSANFETYSKVGDSLAGRYFPFRLHPIDIREAVMFLNETPTTAFDKLMSVGGFPEPYLAGDVTYCKRWQRTHLDIILKQDLLDLKTIKSIKSVEVMIGLLSDRVGSTIAYANIARDLEVDPKTVKEWIRLLEKLYAIFIVSPYHHNIARSLLKEPKCYFFDNARVRDNAGARLENLVASALKKACHYHEDIYGEKAELYFLRTKDDIEIDFLVTVDNKPFIAVEVKASDDTGNRSFDYFQKYIKVPHQFQLVYELKREKDLVNGVKVRNLVDFLSNIDLLDLIKRAR